MRYLRIMMAALLFCGMAASAFAEQKTTVDLDKLPPELVKQLMEQRQKDSAGLLPTTPAEAKAWAGVGKEVADAIGSTAKELGVEINEFVKTPVGWCAMFLIVYLVIGKTFLHLGLGLIIFSFLSFCWFKSMKRFFWSDYQFASAEGKAGCGILHGAAAAFIMIGLVVTVFTS